MLLTVRDVAQVLHVAETTVERWAAESALPTMRIAAQYRFNRIELLEWATIRQIAVDPQIFHLGEVEPGEMPSLSTALERGGIHRISTVQGKAAWSEVVAGFQLPKACDASELVNLLDTRHGAAWTYYGHGITVPHPRYPIVMPVEKPLLQLCFFDWKIRLGDTEQDLVDTVFVLLCPTVKSYLTLTALLCGAMADARFGDVVKRKASTEVILGEARRFNGGFPHRS